MDSSITFPVSLARPTGRWLSSIRYAVMSAKCLTTFCVSATVLLISVSLPSAHAQDCRLQIRHAGFEPFKGYAILKISFASTTNSCAGVRAAVEWSDNLVAWYSVSQTGLPCVTQGAEVQVVDETDARTRPRRFYRARAAAACP
jgi:hypothetical protein